MPMTLAEAAKMLPPLRGKRVNVSTLFRWCKRGVRGVYLEYSKVGRTIVVTESGLQTFFAELTEVDKAGYASSTVTRKRRPRRIIGAARQRAIQDANQVLLRAGIITSVDGQQEVCMAKTGSASGWRE